MNRIPGWLARGLAAAAALVTAGPAFGQATGDYLNLSFTGDGETPSALERFAAVQPKGAPPTVGAVGGGSLTGDATWFTASGP